MGKGGWHPTPLRPHGYIIVTATIDDAPNFATQRHLCKHTPYASSCGCHVFTAVGCNELCGRRVSGHKKGEALQPSRCDCGALPLHARPYVNWRECGEGVRDSRKPWGGAWLKLWC